MYLLLHPSMSVRWLPGQVEDWCQGMDPTSPKRCMWGCGSEGDVGPTRRSVHPQDLSTAGGMSILKQKWQDTSLGSHISCRIITKSVNNKINYCVEYEFVFVLGKVICVHNESQ